MYTYIYMYVINWKIVNYENRFLLKYKWLSLGLERLNMVDQFWKSHMPHFFVSNLSCQESKTHLFLPVFLQLAARFAVSWSLPWCPWILS